jgi:hypothetical protein
LAIADWGFWIAEELLRMGLGEKREEQDARRE